MITVGQPMDLIQARLQQARRIWRASETLARGFVFLPRERWPGLGYQPAQELSEPRQRDGRDTGVPIQWSDIPKCAVTSPIVGEAALDKDFNALSVLVFPYWLRVRSLQPFHEQARKAPFVSRSLASDLNGGKRDACVCPRFPGQGAAPADVPQELSRLFWADFQLNKKNRVLHPDAL